MNPERGIFQIISNYNISSPEIGPRMKRLLLSIVDFKDGRLFIKKTFCSFQIKFSFQTNDCCSNLIFSKLHCVPIGTWEWHFHQCFEFVNVYWVNISLSLLHQSEKFFSDAYANITMRITIIKTMMKMANMTKMTWMKMAKMTRMTWNPITPDATCRRFLCNCFLTNHSVADTMHNAM